MKLRAMVIILMGIFLLGCAAKLTNYPKEECIALSDDNVVKVVQGNCNLCHSKDFSTKQDICERKTLIIKAVADGRMPKIGKLTEDEKRTIIEWK